MWQTLPACNLPPYCITFMSLVSHTRIPPITIPPVKLPPLQYELPLHSMTDIRVFAYSAIDSDTLTLVAGPCDCSLSQYDINFVFATARFLVQELSLFASDPPDFTKLNFIKHAGYREFVKHVSAHMMTAADNTVYVPLPGMSPSGATLQVSDGKLVKSLIRKLDQGKKADFASGAVSGAFINYEPCELDPEAEYAVFHLRGFDPYSGLADAIFHGTYASMGQSWTHYHLLGGETPSDTGLQYKKGIVITGANYSAYDTTQPWISDFVSLLNRIYSEFPRVKLVGVCFGSHVLAIALGGQAAKSSDYDFFYGVEKVCFCGDFAYHFPSFPYTTLDAAEGHGDVVVRLPPDAVLYAVSKTSRVEIWGVPNRVLCFQGHPELCRTILVNFHVDLMRSRNVTSAVEHYDELKAEFDARPAHAKELRKLARAFLQA